MEKVNKNLLFKHFFLGIVDCQMQPCADGATCVISNGAASKCLCQRGFYGRFCETAIGKIAGNILF